MKEDGFQKIFFEYCGIKWSFYIGRGKRVTCRLFFRYFVIKLVFFERIKQKKEQDVQKIFFAYFETGWVFCAGKRKREIIRKFSLRTMELSIYFKRQEGEQDYFEKFPSVLSAYFIQEGERETVLKKSSLHTLELSRYFIQEVRRG